MRKTLFISILIFVMINQLSYSQKQKIKHYDIHYPENITKSDSIFIREALEEEDSIMARRYRNPNDTNLFRNTKGTFWIYDGQGNVIGGSGKWEKVGPVKLIDSLTNNQYILDSTHINITAFDKSGKVKWITDPYKDNSIEEYRTKRPVIIHYGFGKSPGERPDLIKEGLKVIWITYNNTQFGFIDLESGKYYYCGQD